MVLDQVAAECHELRRNLRWDYFEATAELAQYGLGDNLGGQVGGSVRKGSGGPGIPVDGQSSIHGYQDVSDALGVVDHDHAASMRPAAHQTLTHAHDFDSARDADRPCAATVLTIYLSNSRVEAQLDKGIAHDRGDEFESFRDRGFRLGLSHGHGKGKCARVEYCCVTAGETFHGRKTVGPRRSYRGRVPPSHPVGTTERDHTIRSKQTKKRTAFLCGHRSKQGVADGRVQSSSETLGGHEQGIHEFVGPASDNVILAMKPGTTPIWVSLLK